MAVDPEHHFDLKAAALSLAEILNKDALSEKGLGMKLPFHHRSFMAPPLGSITFYILF
ncbi:MULTISPECIES: hypothetical protein [Corynebacterium]|uniref:hypothetical protein n=1 Tax=Corynebacterium TaxID=1716 RepID=UPI001EF19F51|nr:MULTISPECIES: hypothetical protein [Corynebacterium]MCG7228465.1 hypothetical protein [Corynebacterium minutissimum]